MNEKKSILEEAQAAVVDRRTRYGESTSHHARTARFWSAYMGIEFTASDVAILQALDKIARQKNDPTYRDSYVDIAGYSQCAAWNSGADKCE